MTSAGPGTRARILAVLRESGRESTAAEIAGRLGIHPNTVRFHLDALTGRGQVERMPAAPKGRGRPSVRVRAVTGMDPGGPRHYRMLAEALVGGLAAAETEAAAAGLAERAGHAWGRRLAALEEPDAPGGEPDAENADPVAVLVRTLGDLDFAPERLGRSDIGLRNCPFLELVGPAGNVVCSVHLGLMRGVLDALGSDIDVARLEPFVRPELCMTHLVTRSPARDGESR